MTRAIPCLKRRIEFLRVAGTRRKWVAPGLIVQIRPHGPTERVPGGTIPGESPPVRVGYTTSKKVGNAVHRNRARRRLREAVAAVFPAQAKPGFDFVIIGRKTTVTRPFSTLIRDLETALKKLNAYRESPAHGGETA